MLHKITRHPTLRWLAPLLSILLLVGGGIIFIFNSEKDEETQATPTPSAAITVYATNAAGGGTEFAADLTKPLRSVECTEWQNAVQTSQVVSPYRVYNQGKLENPQEFKVIIFTSSSADDNWLFRWSEAQSRCPNNLFPVAVYNVDKDGDQLVLDHENPVSFLTCQEVDPDTLLSRGIADKTLVDMAGTALVANDFRLIERWHSRLDVAVYVLDLEAFCGVSLDS